MNQVTRAGQDADSAVRPADLTPRNGVRRIGDVVRDGQGWALYALAWAGVAAVDALIVVTQGYTTVGNALQTSAVASLAGGLAGVGVWRVTAHIGLPRRGRRAAFFAGHVLLAVAYGGLWLLVQYGWIRWRADADVANAVMRFAAVWILLQGIGVYAIIAGLSYLVRTRRHLREQKVASARAEAAAAQAQLAALRAQLNPHFLFNALHSITTLVRHDPRAAEDALEALGELLRYALDRGATEHVLLADEWRFTRTYLSIERRRLGSRLHVDAELSDAALACAVPPFVLQPLVENAVRHGIAGHTTGGRVGIRADVSDDRLVIQVSDDGDGAEAERIAAATGVGLSSLRELLRARFHGEAALRITTAPGHGFTATVHLPCTDGSRCEVDS